MHSTHHNHRNAKSAVTTSWTAQPFVTAILDALFPPRCAGCGQIGTWFCADCRTAIEFIRPPLCPRCGLPATSGDLCSACRRDPPRLDGLRSVAFFQGPLREAIHALKYRTRRGLATVLGQLLADCARQESIAADIAVPVPLHPTRLHERGYNQSALLANELGRQLGIAVREDVLTRVRHTAPQMTLNATQRQINVQGAFRCRDPGVAGHRVLLIDDVCTTGATLSACAAALREAGAASVWALTLAREK
jgi:ComF family protein